MAASRLKDVRLVHSRARIHHAGLRGATRLELIRIAASRPDDVLRLRTRGLGFDKRHPLSGFFFTYSKFDHGREPAKCERRREELRIFLRHRNDHSDSDG